MERATVAPAAGSGRGVTPVTVSSPYTYMPTAMPSYQVETAPHTSMWNSSVPTNKRPSGEQP